jgi:hypothetical protein
MSAGQIAGEGQDWCILIQEASGDQRKGEVTAIRVVMILRPRVKGKINWD